MTKVLNHVAAGVVTGDSLQALFQLAKAGLFALPAVYCVNSNTINATL